jgi:formate hydrogenlyase subunit 6/NADH:ubiquinone oxidoreductase subunit I
MDNASVMPQVDETLCTLCGLCVEACPCHAVKLADRGPIFSCPETCPNVPACAQGSGGCCLCEEVCPTGAITYSFEIVLQTDRDETPVSGG